MVIPTIPHRNAATRRHTRRHGARRSGHRQRGIVLIMSVIFLLILSIIGISAMQSSTLDQRITTNMQSLLHAFQYAESGIASAVKDPQLTNGQQFNVIFCAVGNDDPGCGDSSAGNASATVTYGGAGKKPPLNYSLDRGFASHFFDVVSTGTAGQAASTHRQGLYIVGPAEL